MTTFPTDPRQIDHRASTRLPLWAVVLTAGLVAMGFGRERHSERPRAGVDEWNRDQPPPHQRGKQASPDGEQQADRGRLARQPSEIPAAGWKDIFIRVYHNVGRDRIVLVAAGVTFYCILALFPAIAALVSLYGLFADPSTISDQVNSLSGVLPGGAQQVIGDQMSRVASQGNKSLGVIFLFGLAVALWSANAGVKSIFDALNLVYNEPEKRGLIKLNAVSLAFTAGAIIFVLLAIGATVVLPIVLAYVGLTDVAEQILRIVRWPVMLLLVTVVLAVLYRYGPSRAEPQWRWITWGSAFAAVAWLVVSLLFSWYAANFGSYNKTYGSLGAIIGFMIWIWISVIVILLGAEIDGEMEHQTTRDTTTGQGKPMGARGAKVADTVGAAQG
jgi:membrane protein